MVISSALLLLNHIIAWNTCYYIIVYRLLILDRNTSTHIIIIHHHVALSAQIFFTLSRHLSLSFIAFGRSSELNPVSAQSCYMQVWAGHPAFARPCEGVHKSTSLMSSSLLLLQQCPTCLVRLILIVFVQDLFNIARSIFVRMRIKNSYRKITIIVINYLKLYKLCANYSY